MLSPYLHTSCALMVLWGITFGLAKAQSSPYLKVQPERLNNAIELEKKAKAGHDPLQLAEAWYLYGKTYLYVGDYRTAQAYFLKSLRIQEALGDSFELSRLYVRLGENEDRVGHSDKALHYATLAFQVAQRIQAQDADEKDEALIRAYGALAHIHENRWNGPGGVKQSEFDKALTYYKKKDFLCQKLKDTLGIAEVSLELGTILTKVKDPQSVPYLKKALHLFTLNHKDNVRANTMMHLASAYLTFDKLDQAIQILNDAKTFYEQKKLNEYEILLNLETQFVRYYEASGQWKQSFEHLKKMQALEKIKLLANQNGAISRLNMEYETEKREALLNAQKKEISLNSKNLQLQRRVTTATFALFVIAAGMSIVFFRLYRKNQRISRRNADLVKEQNHRVKNNLQVISSLLSLQSKRLADVTAKKAIEESRLRVQSMAIVHQRLYDGNKLAEVTLDDFFQELVKGVLNAYGYPTVQTHFAIDPITLSADKGVPLGLILNELTTNACKYAFPANAHPIFRVDCHQTSNTIRLRVADNGPGLFSPGREDVGHDQASADGVDRVDPQPGIAATPPMSAKKTSFGRQLIQAQVDQLDGTCQFGVDKEGVGSGVVFTMEFNV